MKMCTFCIELQYKRYLTIRLYPAPRNVDTRPWRIAPTTTNSIKGQIHLCTFPFTLFFLGYIEILKQKRLKCQEVLYCC